MNQSVLRNCSVLLVFASVFAFAGIVGAQQSMDIVGGQQSVQGTGSASFEVQMTNTAAVEGYVAAVSYDNSTVAITSVTAGSAATSNGAELIVPEILSTGFTLGVVMDATAPFDGQTIPSGSGQNIGNFTAQSITILGQGDPCIVTGFDFVDSVLNNPPLDNILVQGGLSVGAGQGLGLNGDAAALEICPPPPAGLEIVSLDLLACPGNVGCVQILLDNDAGATQGFVLSISHDPGVATLVDINTDGTETEAAGAEFEATNILGNGGTIGVVLDFTAPFDGQAIPAGQDLHIANYCYSCPVVTYFEGTTPPPTVSTALTFVDGVFGAPPLDNVVVVGGLSINPNQTNGQLNCVPCPIPAQDTTFSCGPRSFEGTMVDPTSGPASPAECITGTLGSDVEICFFYTDADGDNLQGLQLAVCFDCNLTFNSFDITGSIFDEVGAEFVNYNIDNDPNDGDGCEFVAGILLDALPPFDRQTAPPTATALLIGCVNATISPNAPCPGVLPVEFCNFINGAGSVLIENIAVIDFQSIQGIGTFGCAVCVEPVPIFQRGDCNSDDKVDLADAAQILGWQFQGEPIDCPDACDANNDGKINLADSVLILNYLFKFGDPPPAPGPENDGLDDDSMEEEPDDLPECMSDDSIC
jgi:hypothetical protein